MSLPEMVRDPGHITRVAKDAEHDCWWVTFAGKCGIQGFGGLSLKDESPEDRAFRDEFAALFGVRFIHDAVGRRCFALRCFDINNEPIEGFEVDGKRWLLTDFRRRFWPDTDWSRLEERKRECRSTIAWANRRAAEAEEMLTRLDGMFVDWTAGAST